MPKAPRRSWTEIGLFAEALAGIAVAGAAIRLLPFRAVVRLMGRAQVGNHAGEPTAVPQLVQAIDRAARRVPWRSLCFDRGLALHWMLRRRGYPSQIHYGLRQGEGRLTAHVWVTSGDRVAIGEERTEPHVCVAVFPAE